MGLDDEQVIKLGLDTGDAAAGAAALADKLGGLQGAAAGAAAAVYDIAEDARTAASPVYELGNSVEIAAAGSRQLGPGLSAVDHAMEEVAKSSARASTALRAVGTAAAATGKGAGNLGQAVTAAGYAFQDFTSTSGDLGQKLNSVTNNLPQLISGLGVGGPLGAGVAALAVGATVLYRNWDSVTGLFEARNPFPETARDVEALRKELEKAKDVTKELEQNTTLTNAQLAKYNQARADTARLEKAVADQMDRQNRVKAGLAAEGEDQKARAAAFQKAQAGVGPETLAGIRAAYEKEAEQQTGLEQAKATQDMHKFALSGASTEEQVAFNAKRQAEFEDLAKTLRTGNDKLADQLYADLLAGAKGAEAKLKRLVEGGTGVNFKGLFDRYIKELPSTKEWEKEFEAQAKEMDKEEADEAKKNDENARRFVKGNDQDAAVAEANRAKDEKAREKDEKAREKARDDAEARREKELAAQVERDQKAFTKRVEAGPLDERAAARYAELKAAGGATDARTGRFTPLDPGQQRERVQRELSEEIERANPGAGPLAAGGAAREITEKVATNVDVAVAQRTAELGRAGVDMNAAGQQALGEALQTIGAMIDQQNQSAAAWGQCAAAARTLRQAIGKARR